MARTSVATDNFNRASLGSNWINVNTGNAGDISINSSVKFAGQYTTQPTNQIAEAVWAGSGSFTNDHYSEIKILNVQDAGGTSQRHGVLARASGSGATRTAYMAVVEQSFASPQTTYIAKIVSGTITILYSSTSAWVDNDKLSIECEGTTIRVCKNGTPLGGSFTLTDSSITTGTPGIAATNAAYGDDWDGGTITSSGPTTATLTGPTSGTTGTTSTNFTVTLNSAATSTVTITPSGTVGTVTFTPASPTITAGNTSTTFTANCNTDGTHAISITTSPVLSYSGIPINHVTTTTPTQATLTGPTSGVTGSASSNFTVTLNSAATSTVTITPTGTNGTVTFIPATPSITAGNTSVTFTATPTSNGAHSISIATSPGLTYVGSPISYTSSSGGVVATTVSLAITSDGTTPVTNLNNLKWAFFDQANPSNFTAPTAQGALGGTNSLGVLTLNITGTTLLVGQTGWLTFSDSNGLTTQNPACKSFSGPVIVS